jgi:DNA-directed RNA polymerase subunit K/omega
MIQLPKEFDSIFRYIVVVSQRAEQIINGAKPRTESRHAKPTLKARDDVEAGEVTWRILTQEELDAHRQALVEQFRAEVDAASERPSTEPIPDVLPTAEIAVGGDDDEERDDELARLQRLLGMTRTAGTAAKDSDDAEGDVKGGDDAAKDSSDDEEEG